MDWRMKIIVATLFILLPATALAELGYHRVPWGSNSWVGPGRPPHWSPAPAAKARPPKPTHPIAPGKPVDPEWGVRPPGYTGGYWRVRRGGSYFGSYRSPSLIYYRPPVETVIVEEVRIVPKTTPVRRSKSPLQCAGQTDTRVDPQTGEIIIEYVTSSRDCP